MIKAFLMILLCISLSSCETLKEIQNSPGLKTVGSFKLGSVQENNYWYDGKSYAYNEYKIEITSEPVSAKIQWNGKTIGTTPLVYSYSGTLDRDERVVMRAIPVDVELPAQEAVFRVRTELPRQINFDLRKKQEGQ